MANQLLKLEQEIQRRGWRQSQSMHLAGQMDVMFADDKHKKVKLNK